MSFYSMAKALAGGEIPGVSLSLAQTKINEALGHVYDEGDYSFQTITSGWLVPGQLANTGTFTVTPFSNQVIANAAATTALASITRFLITTLQYRDPQRSLYSIVGYDTTTNAPFATLTLDRPWMEPTSGPGQPYMIYQAYFPAPVADWRKFTEIRDTTDDFALDYWSFSQSDLAEEDPERTDFSTPKYVVPYQTDQRPGSATLGYMLYELWPHQLSYVPYTFTGRRRGPQLVNMTDTVPYPLTEELVMWRSRECLYQYKAAQSEEKSPNSGRGWMMLAAQARSEYMDPGKNGEASLLDKIRAIDLNLHNDGITRVRSTSTGRSGRPFSNNAGGLNIGGYPEGR